MNNKPESINIMGHKVIIQWKQELEWLGVFYGDINTIQILDPQPFWERTLLHECIHAIFFYSGLKEFMNTKMEEALTNGLEYGLCPLVDLKFLQADPPAQ